MFLLATSLLLGQSDARGVVDQAEALFRTFTERGQTDADKSRLLSFFREHDAEFDANPEYLLAKAHYLALLGSEDAARAAFDRVPDEALTAPLDLFNRLQTRFT